MLSNAQAIAAVSAWVADTLPEVAGSMYEYPPTGKSKALPDCVVELTTEGPARDDDQFPVGQLQQAGVYVWRIGLSLMVDAGVADEDAEAAQAVLYDFGERLKRALFADETLGARVPMASPWAFEVDYSSPMVQYADGTRGREVAVGLAVGELLHEE